MSNNIKKIKAKNVVYDVKDETARNNITALQSGKVDKVTGKGLSTVDFTDSNYVHTDNNFTNTEKSKLNGIETGANKTIIDNNLNDTSTNPVQNKVIKSMFEDLKTFVKRYPKQPFTLSLVTSSEYVVADEEFTLTATLVNSEGEGIPLETINLVGSDGSEYYGITNNQGVASFIIDSISEDTTYTASYEDLSSSTTVELCLYYDSLKLNARHENWSISGGTLENEADGGKFTSTSTSFSVTPVQLNAQSSYWINAPFTAKFTLIETTGSTTLNARYDGGSNHYIYIGGTTDKGKEVEINYDGSTLNFIVGGVNRLKVDAEVSTNLWRVQFASYSDQNSFKIKDFRVKAL